MEKHLKMLNEGFERKYIKESNEYDNYDDELVLNSDDLFISCYSDIDEEELKECDDYSTFKESLNSLVESLTEASVDPQTINDTEVLKSIEAKIAGKKYNPKNLTPEEKNVLDKYGLDAWGYKGETTIATPGKNNVLNPNKYDVKEFQAQKRGKINIADRASKLDNRANASGDIKKAYTGNSDDTFQNKNNAYVSNKMSKNVRNMKGNLRDRKNAQDQLNGRIEGTYKNDVLRAKGDNDLIDRAKERRRQAIEDSKNKLNKAQSNIDYILKNKKKRESLKEYVDANSGNIKIIQTGLDKILPVEVANEIIDSILGQISDGMWENTPGMSKYWEFAGADGPNIEVDMSPRSGYVGKSDQEIKKFFANRLKAICQQWLHDNNINPYNNWNANCQEVCDYLGHFKTDITIGDAYKAYQILSGKTDKSINEGWSSEDFKSEIYNALADIVFKWHSNGYEITEDQMDEAIEWFQTHFWEDEELV